MGWTKQSSGNYYDSQSSHLYTIGLYEQKIIDCCIYFKVYNICQQTRIKKIMPKSQYCEQNWKGLFKSIESSLILKYAKKHT